MGLLEILPAQLANQSAKILSMNYLETNRALLSEVSKLSFDPLNYHNFVKGTGGSRNTTYTLGSYSSEIAGKEIFLATKLRDPNWAYSPEEARRVFAEQLGFVASLVRNFEDLAPQLPNPFGLIIDGEGSPTGMLVEDFSEGNKYRIEALRRFELLSADIPFRRLRDFMHLEGVSIENHNLLVANMFFMARPSRLVPGFEDRREYMRIGDFDHAMEYQTDEEKRENYPEIVEVERNLEAYTIKIPNLIP